MTSPEPPAASASKPPSRMPIMMTAFGFPGAGQFMQKRWLAGTVISLAVTATLVAFFVYAVRIIWGYYSLAFDFEGSTPPLHPPWRQLLGTFAVFMVVYVIAVIDVWVGHRRACAEWARRRAGVPPPPPAGG
jgi:hypothetical protein